MLIREKLVNESAVRKFHLEVFLERRTELDVLKERR